MLLKYHLMILIVENKPTSEQWNFLMNSIQKNYHKPIEVPKEHIEYYIDYLTNVLPPIIWGSKYVLCSEPYDIDLKTDKDMYTGFFIKNDIGYAVITTVLNFNLLKS